LQKHGQKTQSRVERARSRQRLFNRALLVAALIIIAVFTAYAVTRPQPFALPSYLNYCIPLKGPFAYSEVFILRIVVGGVEQTVPQYIGVASKTCVRPIYTLTTSGGIHIDSPQNRTYTLGDVFLVWASTYGDQYSTFNQNQLFVYKAGNGHSIGMTVNNQTNTDYENYQLPRNANTQTNQYNITITYT
jgi:hypothetical protein